MSNNEQQIIFRKSNRVILRPPLREDVPLLVRWMNDPEVTQYLGAHTPMLEADEEEWFEKLPKRKSSDIILTIVVDGKAIGIMGLHDISWKNRTAETGTFIGEKEYWGQGYGSEAKMLLLDYAFNALGLRKICSSVFAYNERSLKYSLKCGYKEEGRLKDQHFQYGRYWDEILLAVFRNDWFLLWEEFAKKHGLTREN
jgi:RimJ/RimL family protein N-acetyltransferase